LGFAVESDFAGVQVNVGRIRSGSSTIPLVNGNNPFPIRRFDFFFDGVFTSSEQIGKVYVPVTRATVERDEEYCYERNTEESHYRFHRLIIHRITALSERALPAK
jgi:hypothetical protein